MMAKERAKELMSAVKASEENMETQMAVSLQATGDCLGKTEANGDNVETEIEAYVEEMEVVIIRVQKDRLGDQRLAVTQRNPRRKRNR